MRIPQTHALTNKVLHSGNAGLGEASSLRNLGVSGLDEGDVLNLLGHALELLILCTLEDMRETRSAADQVMRILGTRTRKTHLELLVVGDNQDGVLCLQLSELVSGVDGDRNGSGLLLDPAHNAITA